MATPEEKAAQDFACETTVPFGKHVGHTLRHIAQNDPGYLDWLISLDYLEDNLLRDVRIVLAIPWVAEAVNRVVEQRKHRSYSEPIENVKKPKLWWEK